MPTNQKTWTPEQIKFIEFAAETYGDGAVLEQEQIKELATGAGQYPHWLIKTQYRVDRNRYRLPSLSEVDSDFGLEEETHNVVADDFALDNIEVPVVTTAVIDGPESYVPRKSAGYVTFGYFDDVEAIIASNMFIPVFISGWSGNGKTLMVEEACARSGRECILANISIETDQADLIGGPTLVDGNVVNREGPVLLAMRRGAVLLLDEVDRGSNKLLCLQTILEGKPYLNKQTNEVVYPAKGFNIIATANTKGKGSDDGRYLSTILDDAFLERFPITVEQEFANNLTEKKILLNQMKIYDIKDDDFVNSLIKWSDRIRKASKDGVVDDVISTRRLCHIIKVYSIFKDRQKAIDYCINRFSEMTKKSFAEFYKMLETNASTPF